MYTGANAYFSGEAGTKGQIKVGQYADAVLIPCWFPFPYLPSL
jgi:predicted amidohydrolase YtcJ